MFNEGVDVPNIDTVLMLRPTESTIIWMQQFGRGLRRAPGKERLYVIDYIGNHRIFLTKARALLQASEGDRALSLKLELLRKGEIQWPDGCEVTYDLEALDLLASLVKRVSADDALEAFYIEYRERHGERPKALDVFHAGFNPKATGHDGWLGFLIHQADLSPAEARVASRHRAFLDMVMRTPMTRSYKMVLLQAMQIEGEFPGSITIERLVDRIALLAARNPNLRRDFSADFSDKLELRRVVEKGPIPAWVDGKGTGGRSYFSYAQGVFSTAIDVEGVERGALSALTQELVDWRIAEYLSGNGELVELTDLQAVAAQPLVGPQTEVGPTLWREYMREDIPPLYNLQFNTGSWNQGFVVQGKDVFLLVTLKKDDLQEEHRYEDRFIDAGTFHWQSQNQTSQTSKHGQIISGAAAGYALHLFVRMEKKRGGKAAPFVYCGDVVFESWTGEKPISVTWRLPQAVPVRLHRTFDVR